MLSFIILPRTIMNDECQQTRNKTNTIWRCRVLDWACVMTVYSSALCISSLPPVFSVVVLYTQGVESKQWREVRDHSHLCATASFQPQLFPSLPCSLSQVTAVIVNHLQLIDPANNYSTLSTVLVVTDWLIKVTFTRIIKDLPLRQNSPWQLTTGP